MSDDTRCGARTKNGDPCQLRPLKGATRCRRHGGASPQAKAAAARRIEKQKLEQEVVKMLGIQDTYEQVNPQDTLLHVLGATAAEERFLANRVAEFSEDDQVLRWTRKDHQEGSGPMGPVDVSTYSAVPDVLVTQLRDARDRLIRYSAMAIKLGLDERRVALAESQADQLAAVFFRAVASTALAPEQREALQQAFASELRALEVAA